MSLEEQPTEASTRESLLDVVLEKLTKSGKTNIVSRVIYVARFMRRESNAMNQKGLLSKVIESHQQDAEITGIMIVYPFCCVNMMEGKTSSLISVIRDIQMTPQVESKIAEARVISCTEDVPVRCYSKWNAGYVSSASSVELMDGLDSTAGVKAASDVNTFLRKVGPSLIGVSEPEIRKRMATLEAFYDDLPATELILALCSTDEAPTLEEYLDIFDSPINIDLDSEKVWPIPAQLKY